MEKRQSLRKDLRVKAVLVVGDGMRISIRTADIGKFGMGLTGLLRQLDIGQDVNVSFELPVGAQIHQITVNGRVSHCVNTPNDGYRAGIQFVDTESHDVSILAQYVGN